MPVVLVDAGGFGDLLIDVEEVVIFVVTEGHCVITVIIVVVSPVDALRESARALRGATVSVRVVDLDDVGTTGALPLVDNLLERANTLKGGSDIELSGERHGLGEARILVCAHIAFDDSLAQKSTRVFAARSERDGVVAEVDNGCDVGMITMIIAQVVAVLVVTSATTERLLLVVLLRAAAAILALLLRLE